MDTMGYDLTVDGLLRGRDMQTLRGDLGCPDDACVRNVFEEFLTHPTWFCDRGPNVYEGGNWIGHVFPGTLFIFWACHWLLGLVRHYFEGLRSGVLFRSRTCYRFLWFPERWPMEAVVKAFFPIVAMTLELWLAHENGYRRLFCSDVGNDARRAGHFVGNHVNNWQHAAMYPGFIVSGIVDLVALRVELPPGTPQVFLGLGFLYEALLFGLHGKHSPMDILVHLLLTAAGLTNALFPVLEAVFLHNPLLTAGRIAATALQGAWFIAAARVMYESHPAWDTQQNTDIVPVLYAPLLLITLTVGIMLALLAAFLLGYMIYRPRSLRGTAVPLSTLSKDQDLGAWHEGQEGGRAGLIRAGAAERYSG